MASNWLQLICAFSTQSLQLNSWQDVAHSPLVMDDVVAISNVVVGVGESVVEVVGSMAVLVVVGGAGVVVVVVVVTTVVDVVVGSMVVVVDVDGSSLPEQLHIIVVMDVAERVLASIELNLSTPPEVIRQPAT